MALIGYTLTQLRKAAFTDINLGDNKDLKRGTRNFEIDDLKVTSSKKS